MHDIFSISVTKCRLLFWLKFNIASGRGIKPARKVMYDTNPNPMLRKTTQAGDQYNPNLRNKSDRSANPYVTDKHVFKTLSDFHQNFSSVHSINYLRQKWTLEDSVVQSFFTGCNSITIKAGLFISPP